MSNTSFLSWTARMRWYGPACSTAGASSFSSMRSQFATARSCSASDDWRKEAASSRCMLTMRLVDAASAMRSDRAGRGAQPLDPAADLLRIGLPGGAVDHQAGRHVRDVLDLDQVV